MCLTATHTNQIKQIHKIVSDPLINIHVPAKAERKKKHGALTLPIRVVRFRNMALISFEVRRAHNKKKIVWHFSVCRFICDLIKMLNYAGISNF